jgi:hypothetical protein
MIVFEDPGLINLFSPTATESLFAMLYYRTTDSRHAAPPTTAIRISAKMP